jgi:DNA-binding transcriptional LysR family regulator
MSIGLEPRKIVAQAVKCSVMTEMVVAGEGIACFPAGGVSRSLEAGTLVILNVDAPALQMDIRQVLSLSARHSPGLETFTEFWRLHEKGES